MQDIRLTYQSQKPRAFVTMHAGSAPELDPTELPSILVRALYQYTLHVHETVKANHCYLAQGTCFVLC